ncbi:Uncharacterised protein [Chlamydia trachomatis]|nr:Uncharacterised protein [Chlamydia trachomatis]
MPLSSRTILSEGEYPLPKATRNITSSCIGRVTVKITCSGLTASKVPSCSKSPKVTSFCPPAAAKSDASIEIVARNF